MARNTDSNKPAELLAAEHEGQEMLLEFFRGGFRRLRDLHERTGVAEATLSRMARNKHPISMEVAILIEVATEGELPAEKLCPSMAGVMAQFRANRRKVKAAA